MTDKHTPGPWQWRAETLMGANNRTIIVVDNWSTAVLAADESLIAAAPELLAACERARDLLEGIAEFGTLGRLDLNGPAISDIRAAIAKAKGTT